MVYSRRSSAHAPPELLIPSHRETTARGKNHAPQEFEDALDGLEGARPGCSVAVALPTAEGEELALLVERNGPVSAEQVKAILKEARMHSTRDWCLLLLTFRHALRSSEARTLKLADIDLESFPLLDKKH